MIACPSLRANFSPELSFLLTDDPHLDMVVGLARKILNGSIKHAAEFNGPIVASTEQVQRGNPRKWTHFMKHRRPMVEKEALDHIEGGF